MTSVLKKKIEMKPQRSVCGVVVNLLHGDIVVNEFGFQSRYYVHFGTNTPGKVWNPFPSSYELNSTITVLL